MTSDRSLPLAIPAAGPLFEGHFPGRPILPAVGLLHLALRALAADGATAALRGIASLRLRSTIAPGETLTLHTVIEPRDGRARLEVRRSADVVARAVVLLGDPPPVTYAATPTRVFGPASAPVPGLAAGTPVAAMPPLDEILPHRPPMRLVGAVEDATDEVVVCAVRLPEASVFNEAGTAPALVALEMAAQTAAASETLRRIGRGGEPGARLGYLVGARDVLFTRARLLVGETLLASVRIAGLALPLCTYAFEVAGRDGIVASGILSTWLTATDA